MGYRCIGFWEASKLSISVSVPCSFKKAWDRLVSSNTLYKMRNQPLSQIWWYGWVSNLYDPGIFWIVNLSNNVYYSKITLISKNSNREGGKLEWPASVPQGTGNSLTGPKQCDPLKWFQSLKFATVCYTTIASQVICRLRSSIGIHEPKPHIPSSILFKNCCIYTGLFHVTQANLVPSCPCTFLHVITLFGEPFPFTSLPPISERNWQALGMYFLEHLSFQV